jgi:hypothetical protein
MADLKKLEQDWKDKEAAAIKIQADKDEAVQKARDKYAERLRKAVDEASKAQQEFADASAAEALVGRDDAEIVANNLGLTLPSE